MADNVVHRVAIAGTDTGFDVVDGERILTAAARSGVWVPFECGWGSCGTCKMTLVGGDVETLFADAPSINPRDTRRGRILACQSTPKSDLVIKPTWVEATPRDGLDTRRSPATLTGREQIGPAIFRLRFTVDHTVSFHEGQHAIIDLGGGLRRCYSMSNRPGSTEIEFIMKRYSGRIGSEAVSALSPDDQVDIEMPYGDVWIRDGNTPVCLVAGGTGIAPMLSMLSRLADNSESRPVRVVYGASSQDELVCWSELADLVEALPDAELVGALSTVHDGWGGVEGLVTHALEPMLDALSGAEFYIAGPPVMTNTVRELLSEHGIQLDRIRYDSFG